MKITKQKMKITKQKIHFKGDSLIKREMRFGYIIVLKLINWCKKFIYFKNYKIQNNTN